MTTLLNTENTGLTTTFKELHEMGACKPSYRKLAKGLGGIRTYGRTTPIKLSQILDICGIDDCLWVIERADLNVDYKRELRLWACDCAARVLPIFESKYPDDHRPRQAIEAARRYARNEIEGKDLSAAWAAAKAAARAAAGAATWAAIWAARGAPKDAAKDAAKAAARAATRAATWGAAKAAAWAARDATWATEFAAWDTERAIQTQSLRDVLVKLEAGVLA